MLRSVAGSVFLAIGLIGAGAAKGGFGKDKTVPMEFWLICGVCFVIGLVILSKKPKENIQPKPRKKKKISPNSTNIPTTND
jgi:hypothetical protein